MSSPVVAPSGSGTPARRPSARARILALVAIVSIVVLIDSEIFAYGIPGIAAGFDLLHLPAIFTKVAVGVLVLLTLWLSVWMARKIWRVEHELDATQRTQQETPSAG